jgi:hypothetical protein
MLLRLFNCLLVLLVMFSAGFLVTNVVAELSASVVRKTPIRNWQQQWVDYETDLQVNSRRMGHYQKCPNGYYAGVGMSTRSAEDAIRRCCYWNSGMRVRWFAVRKSGSAWFASALYKR